ncbi:MAG TPA: nicotinamide-nucleotide amidohydrolase family protein [Candidatus Limnocylindrales bacterium]|nr:nicotinamide-nucleotide amidohydrolase family protein [Candidatus Limnocylindrales bacterium]
MPDASLVALAERLQVACVGRGLTVATAESCTGGLVAASITAVPGSSAYFRGAVVGYANDVKIGLLAVPPAALEAHGAVSAQVARAMAEGCRARLGTALAVSVTGIAGPDGGSESKPVGLTYVGLASARPTEVRRFVFAGDRAAVRGAAAAEALTSLIAAAEDGQ